MSKLSFRARALDASKPLPIYRSFEIEGSADCSLINRAVPQMPTGMEKEEESEHHLQRAICVGSVIPTPEVIVINSQDYETLHPKDFKPPRQLIHMQPFNMDSDILDYDMDSEDEIWVNSQGGKLELSVAKFEEMMDRLEKGSGQTVVTLQEAKALIKEDDDLIIAVYDYWLNKRLKLQHPLIPQVRTEARFGVSNHNPYIAFRRRTEKMQTRKNRKNDESSYEKMLKLKRDLTRAVTLLEMIKRREKSKRELLRLTLEVFEKRFQAGDYSGQLVSEALSTRPPRPAFTPIFQPNHMSHWVKDESLLSALTRKEKRHYKKKRHKTSKAVSSATATSSSNLLYPGSQGSAGENEFASSEEDIALPGTLSDEDEEDEGPYAFHRQKDCNYHAPRDGSLSADQTGDKRFQFFPTSVTDPKGRGYKYVGFCRRRVGRGGRVILDRVNYRNEDEFWRSMGYEVYDSALKSSSVPGNPSAKAYAQTAFQEPNGVHPYSSGLFAKTSNSVRSTEDRPWKHYRPKTPEPKAISTSATSVGTVADDDDLEIEDCYNPDEPVEKKPNLGSFLGAVVAAGEKPLMFETQKLVQDPLICEPSYTSSPSDDTILLDQPNADLSNAVYLLKCEVQDLSDAAMTEHYGLTEFQLDNPWVAPSSNFPSTTPDSTSDSSSSCLPSSSTTSSDLSSSINARRAVNSTPSVNKDNIRPVVAENSILRTNSVTSSVDDDGSITTVVQSGELNFIVDNLQDSVNHKRRNSVDKDDKENNKSSLFRGGGNGGGSGETVSTENGESVSSSLESISNDRVVSTDESSRTSINNNVINMNSSRSSGTFQYVVDSGIGPVVGEGLDAATNSLVAKGVVVGDTSNSSSSKTRTNGLQLVNMKNYSGSPEKLCHIIT